MTVRPVPDHRVLLWRGATRGCAVCGRRRLTSRWFTLHPNCPRCGFAFERQPGHFIGAVGVNTVVTVLLILATLLGGIAISWPDVRAFPLAAGTLSVALIIPLVFYPTSKTLWVAVDLMFHPLEPGEATGGPEEAPPPTG